MQRAAVSSLPSTPRTPPSDSSPASKRQRLSNGASNPRYSTDEMNAIQAALAEEEQQRAAVLEKHAANMGETRWVLSVRKEATPKQAGLVVQSTGFAEIDHDSDENESEAERPKGRVAFGKVGQHPRVNRCFLIFRICSHSHRRRRQRQPVLHQIHLHPKMTRNMILSMSMT
jgi:hypothetical protein